MKSTSVADYILKLEKENAELKIVNAGLADDIKTLADLQNCGLKLKHIVHLH